MGFHPNTPLLFWKKEAKNFDLKKFQKKLEKVLTKKSIYVKMKLLKTMELASLTGRANGGSAKARRFVLYESCYSLYNLSPGFQT